MATDVVDTIPATEREPTTGALQRAGAAAALVDAATFVVGFALFLTLIAESSYGSVTDPAASVAFLAANATLLYAWNLVIYVVFGVALVVLALALHERVREGTPVLARVATAFGLVWAGLVIASGMVANVGASAVLDLYAQNPAAAESLWLAVRTVETGLGGGNEIAGGLWVVLVSVAALRAGALSRVPTYLGVVVGAAGLLTVVPALGDLGAVFGLGLVVWVAWVGVALFRGPRVEEHTSVATP